MEALIARPDGIESGIALSDDGSPPDTAPDDGIYTGMYSETTVRGFCHVLVEANGVHATQEFRGTAQAIFPVAPSTTVLSGSCAEYLVDDKADGLYECLDVDVGVDAAQTGDYTVAAVPEGPGDAYIDLANATVLSTTGVVTVTLHFDGQAIRLSRMDGPYTVTEVLLIDDPALIKLDEADDVWVTAPYGHLQFGEWVNWVYLPLTLRNH